MRAFTFTTAGCIVVGAGEGCRLHAQCRRLGIARPLLVTDPGLVAIGLVEPVLEALKSDGFEPVVYDQVREDPPEAVVLAAVDRALEADIDGVIGFGGGSSMDVAKLVAVLMVCGQSLADIYGVDQVSGARLPLVLVPTTACTGCLVQRVAARCCGSGSGSYSGPAAESDRDDRHRCHGARHRGLHLENQEESHL